eukprot:2710726-Rhodomonas_salina.1
MTLAEAKEPFFPGHGRLIRTVIPEAEFYSALAPEPMSSSLGAAGSATASDAVAAEPADMAARAPDSRQEAMEVEAVGTLTPASTVCRPAAGPSALSDASVPAVPVVTPAFQADDAFSLSSR